MNGKGVVPETGQWGGEHTLILAVFMHMSKEVTINEKQDIR